MLPVYCPARLPAWDSGWDDGYETNEFSGEEGLKVESSPASPFLLRVPRRRICIIGHRGTPYRFPEKTIPSFRMRILFEDCPYGPVSPEVDGSAELTRELKGGTPDCETEERPDVMGDVLIRHNVYVG